MMLQLELSNIWCLCFNLFREIQKVDLKLVQNIFFRTSFMSGLSFNVNDYFL